MVPAQDLPPGCASLHGVQSHQLELFLGSRVVGDCLIPDAPPGELHLSTDVWDRLLVPFASIRMQVNQKGIDAIELGPSIAVLYGGTDDGISQAGMLDRAHLYFGHLQDGPRLFAIGFTDAIEWTETAMVGYVVKNRLYDGPPALLPARFPILGVVRLTWAIPRPAIERLRYLTENRTFNWVRNLSKLQFHSLLKGIRGVGEFLPDTRRLRDQIDLAAMIAKYGVVFAKSAYSVQGRAVARVRRDKGSFEVSHIRGGGLSVLDVGHLADLWETLRQVLGRGPYVVQQGIPITGKNGRALDFRVVITRDRDGRWWSPLTTAKVTPDDLGVG